MGKEFSWKEIVKSNEFTILRRGRLGFDSVRVDSPIKKVSDARWVRVTATTHGMLTNPLARCQSQVGPFAKS